TIVMDGRGLAGMATRENAARLRRLNFGIRSLQKGVSVETISAEIERYDADEAAALSAALRPMIDLELQLNQLESIHSEIVEEFAGASVNLDELIVALRPILHRWLPRFPGTD